MSITTEKGTAVCDLFNRIAPYYDFINSLASFGRHHYWRQALIELSGVSLGAAVLDVCCGTGLISIGIAKKTGTQGKVIGVDFSEGMLEIARRNCNKAGLGKAIELLQADALSLPFAANTFDCAVIGYGLRNMNNLRQALLEIMRVIKPGARLASLELAHPYLPVFKPLYYLYLNRWIPFIGKILAGNQYAYQYLAESVRNYPKQGQVTKIFSELGFLNPQCYELTWGIAAIHTGIKPG